MSKSVYRKSYIWIVFAICLLYISIKHLKQNPKLWKIWIHWSLKETGTGYEQIFFSRDNLGQKYLAKIKKYQAYLETTIELWYLLLCSFWPLLPKTNF